MFLAGRRREFGTAPAALPASRVVYAVAERRERNVLRAGLTRFHGVVGTGLIAGLLVLFQSIAVLSSTQVVLNLPIAVQEMVLAVWLIVKGFSPKAKAPAPTAAVLSPALTRQHAEQP